MRRGLISRSKIELPDAVLDKRVARLRVAMTASGLDALMVYSNITQPAGVSWLTGFVPYWSEALLVLPVANGSGNGAPVLVVALTFRVKPWIERTSRAAQVIHTPRIGIEAARLVAGKNPQASVGVVDFDRLAAGIADDLREAAPHLAFHDASDLFATLRARPDPAEIMLAARADMIAQRALAAVPACPTGTGAVIAAIEAEARGLGAEEVYVAAAPDLGRDLRLMRIEGERALGETFAVRASVAYKGSWVRRLRTFSQAVDAGATARHKAAGLAFGDAVAQLPSAQGLARFASFLVEGCRLSQPLEPLIGSRIAEPRPLGPGAVVSVQACITVDDRPILVGAPALTGEPGAAASLLGSLD